MSTVVVVVFQVVWCFWMCVGGSVCLCLLGGWKGGGGGMYQDVDYPWFFIIQWACEKIPSDAVFKWNLPDIKSGTTNTQV